MISLKEVLENYSSSGDAEQQNQHQTASSCNIANVLQDCSCSLRTPDDAGQCGDGLTGVMKRSCVECLIDARIKAGIEFCVAAIEVDGLKEVTSAHGRIAGDKLVNLFVSELRSMCRSMSAGELGLASRATELIGRWSGDEFILLLDCNLSQGIARMQRLSRWVCGDYTLPSQNRGVVKLHISASYGLVNHRRQESRESLIDRALASMNEQKGCQPGKITHTYAGLHI